MSDNHYYAFNCPAKMSDGRFLTNYHENNENENFYQSVFQSTSEHDYRKKLQTYGDHIIKGTLYYQVNANTCKCNNEPCRFK